MWPKSSASWARSNWCSASTCAHTSRGHNKQQAAPGPRRRAAGPPPPRGPPIAPPRTLPKAATDAAPVAPRPPAKKATPVLATEVSLGRAPCSRSPSLGGWPHHRPGRASHPPRESARRCRHRHFECRHRSGCPQAANSRPCMWPIQTPAVFHSCRGRKNKITIPPTVVHRARHPDKHPGYGEERVLGLPERCDGREWPA